MIILLSSATVAKYFLSKKIIFRLTKKNKLQPRTQGIYYIFFGLFFCFAIPDPFSYFVLNKMYLGRFVPVVWHNSTTILLFPFAILLFWKQLKIIDSVHKTTLSEILVINILVIINVLIKPSFLFVYMPVTFIFLLKNFKINKLKSLFLKLTPLFTGTVIIIAQYYLLFILQKGTGQHKSSSVEISQPFEVLNSWIPTWFIPISLLLSFALPIFSLFFYKEILKYKPFLYALCLTIFGILISAFLKETEDRMLHGNFMWQNIICAYLLFLATISFLIPKFFGNNLRSKKIIFLKGLFFAHALSGILYILKMTITLNYF
ncbi:MAG: hypothetical protein ACPGTO_10570 [Polaribacter sp.]